MKASSSNKLPWGCWIGVGLGVVFVIWAIYLNLNPHLANQIRGVETYKLAGDVSHFDPLAALPEIRSRVGHDAHLTKITMDEIRKDGTMDLTRTFDPLPKATFRFFYKADKGPVDGPPPEGSGTNAVWLQEVDAECYQVGKYRRTTTYSRSAGYTNEGLDLEKMSITAGPLPKDIGAPKISLSKLWDVTIKGGQDPNATAEIVYDGTEFRFYKDDLKTYWLFDVDGKVKP